ncbi:uncharacterized protein [Procambarus clarkii]|uniref:uncharacterized protein n=1 Tax=Procambarus clarkii TaxID=6728 RepID=UPI003742D28C
MSSIKRAPKCADLTAVTSVQMESPCITEGALSLEIPRPAFTFLTSAHLESKTDLSTTTAEEPSGGRRETRSLQSRHRKTGDKVLYGVREPSTYTDGVREPPTYTDGVRGLPPTQTVSESLPPTQTVSEGLPPTQTVSESLPPTQTVSEGLPPTQTVSESLPPTRDCK